MADLPGEPAAPGEWPTTDDDSPADPDLAGYEDRVVDADRGAPTMLGEDPGIRIVADHDRHRDLQPSREPRTERDVHPAQVRGHRDQTIAAAHDPRHGHADADDRPIVPGTELASEAGEVRDHVVDGEVPARSVDPDPVLGFATEPDDRCGDRIDQDLKAQHDGPIRDEPDQRRRTTRRPESDREILRGESRAGELADQRADRTPGQARGGHQTRAGLRAALMEATDDGAEIGSMGGLASLPDVHAAKSHDL